MITGGLVLAATGPVSESVFFTPPFLILAAVGAAVAWRIAFLDAYLRAARNSAPIPTLDIARASLLSGAGYFAFAMLAARGLAGIWVERTVTAEALSFGVGLVFVCFAKPAGVLASLAPMTSKKSSSHALSAAFDEKREQLQTMDAKIERSRRELGDVIGDTEITVGTEKDAIKLRLPDEVVGVLIEQPSASGGLLTQAASAYEAARFKQSADTIKLKANALRELIQARQSLWSELVKANELPQQLLDEQRERERQRMLDEARFEAEMMKLGAQREQHATEGTAAIQKREKLIPKTKQQKLEELVEEVEFNRLAQAAIALKSDKSAEAGGIMGAFERAQAALANSPPTSGTSAEARESERIAQAWRDAKARVAAKAQKKQ